MTSDMYLGNICKIFIKFTKSVQKEINWKKSYKTFTIIPGTC